MTGQPRPHRIMPEARRTVFALLVVALTAAILGGAIGFAAAGEKDGSFPKTFGVAEPFVGDKGVYTVTVVEETETGPVEREAERPWYEFEWKEPRDLLDGRGILRRVNQLVYNPYHLDEAGVWTPSGHRTALVLPGNHTILAEDIPSEGSRSTPTGFTQAQPFTENASWSSRTTWFETRDGIGQMIPCGLYNAIQGVEVDLEREIVLFERCTLSHYWTDETTFEARAQEDIAGFPAVAFSKTFPKWQWGSKVHLWMTADLPYPIRIAVEHSDGSNVYDVARLTQFARGTRPLDKTDQPVGAQPVVPALKMTPRNPWGPDDSGINHPFRLSEAWAHASREGALSQLLAKSPDAYADRAGYMEARIDARLFRTWIVSATDGHERVTFGLSQETRPITPPPSWFLPIRSAPTETVYSYNNGTDDAPPGVPPSQAERFLPTAESLVERWTHYASPDYVRAGANTWGFQLGDGWYAASAGNISQTSQSGPALIGPGWTRSLAASLVSMDQSGHTHAIQESRLESAWESSPLPTLDQGKDANAVGLADLQVEVWSFPTGRYAVATGLIAGLTGLVYWLWPTLKGLAARGFAGLPLFSRIDRSGALDHPMRSQLVELIGTEPGIHFEEITRRVGQGRGTVDHHLRKLLDVGLINRVEGKGYTCYFPKGSVDRRLMAAVPVLKSEGARRILQCVLATPGGNALFIAKATGLTQPTVTYHLKRLSESQLVLVDRVGSELRLSPTDLGRAAASGWTTTAN